MLTIILVVLLVLLLAGGVPAYRANPDVGGVIGLLLLIVVVVLILRLCGVWV